MLSINNVRIYGLEESILASGYPMISEEIGEWPRDLSLEDKDTARISRLGQAPGGSGHDCALKGIIVQFDVTYPQYWTPQFQRYHFADIVSSTSKMHRLVKMDVANMCNEYVDQCVIDNLNTWIGYYNNFLPSNIKPGKMLVAGKFYTKQEIFMKIISNTPGGLEQTMRVTTSYLQLKTIYQQRRHHKLEDWHVFCDWVETLPHFLDFTGVKKG